MTKSILRRGVVALGVVAAAGVAVVVAGTMLLAQSAISRLGLTDADAGKRFNRVVTSPEYSFGYRAYEDGVMAKAYKALPTAGRVQVAEGLVAFWRAYSSSGAFTTAYARSRDEKKPQPVSYEMTVDQELKQKIDAQTKEMADGIKSMLAMLPPDQRAESEAAYKQMAAMLKTPEAQKAMRDEIEQKRASDKEAYDEAMKKWQEAYPADSRVAVARWIRNFLDGSADVDYTATTVSKNGLLRFTNPDYERKPDGWKFCYRAGKEPVAAARAAMVAWLKEVSPR